MTRRKGEVTRADLKRNWPHHVALPAEKVRSFTDTLTVAPSQLHMCRDNVEFMIFCFSKPEDAEAFANRFAW